MLRTEGLNNRLVSVATKPLDNHLGKEDKSDRLNCFSLIPCCLQLKSARTHSSSSYTCKYVENICIPGNGLQICSKLPREVGSVNRSSWHSHVPQLKVLADLHKRSKLPDLLLVDVVVTSVLPQHAHNASDQKYLVTRITPP